MMTELKEKCDGFSLSTPCSFNAECLFVNGSSYILVHPLEKDHGPDVFDLIELIDDPTIPTPGHSRTLESGPWPRCVIGNRILLIGNNTGDGWCPLPIIIPPTYDTDVNGDVSDRILIFKIESRSMPDGNLSIVRTIIVS
jgi:hypothetical protein